ncbi:hypothetical protein N8I74_14530 [Chitiniphilus purpureus]|uniref:Uncharacterized protein n=1 Tax=Chitiniphilus purpureus TaxID=2981137 RepID=A0ABY6DJJ8_9NEIS|nr:hypothetical protein [Chitiniphilus sp. CD1]UXY14525.1 hypothetical protein N8I74_14530 [Chitiniphilus sp. CD1]
MQTINFMCADEQSADLAEFAQRVFSALDVMDSIERTSSNYLDERYFVGSVGGGQLTVALSDESGFDDLPYWLSVEAETASNIPAHLDALIKERLRAAGVRFAKIESFGKKDMRRVDY